MTSIFKTRKITHTLKEFYEKTPQLPVIIYIEEGFAGNNPVETVGAGQYFFIHAIYRQRRVMSRGHIPSLSAEKCMFSIPLAYPIKFRRVESRLQVGEDEFLWSLLNKHEPPFQIQLSRKEPAILTVGHMSVKTSAFSNLLVMGKYKEIFLLGNPLDNKTGSLYLQVTAIPLYLPGVKIATVEGFTNENKTQFLYYIDELYAFALQEINLRGHHGNQDITIFNEGNSPESKLQICEYLIPDRYMSLEVQKEKDKPPPKAVRKYKPSFKYDNTPGRQPHSKVDIPTLERERVSESQTAGNDPYYVTNQLRMDYTPLDDIKDLKLPLRLQKDSVEKPMSEKMQSKEQEQTKPKETHSQLPLKQHRDSALSITTDENVSSTSSEELEQATEGTKRRITSSRTKLQKQLSEELKTNLLDMKHKRSSIELRRDKPLPAPPEEVPVESKGDEITSTSTPASGAEPEIPEPDYDTHANVSNRRKPEEVIKDDRRPGVYVEQEDWRFRGKTPKEEQYYGSGQQRKTPEFQELYSTEARQHPTPSTSQIENMTISDVGDILRKLNLHKYVAVFRSEMIDGFTLLDFKEEEELRTCFNFSLIESKRLMNFIRHGRFPKYKN